MSEIPTGLPGESGPVVIAAQPAVITQSSSPMAQALATPVTWTELIIGFVVLLVWFVLFAGGILVPTGAYRDRLNFYDPTPPTTQPSSVAAGKPTVGEAVGDALAIFAFWTITNVGLLSCLAAFLGAVGRRTRFAMQGSEQSDPDAIPNQIRLHYASAVIRGFGIYGLMMAGLLVLATDTFTTPTQGQYLRLSATISVLAFYSGYDPAVFAGVLQRVKKLLDQGSAGPVK
jgi:hypothetical protein